MIAIKEATGKDYPIIQRIAHQTWPVTFGSILSKEQIEYMLEMMYSLESLKEQVAKNHKFLLAAEETGYLGFASYEISCKGLPKTKIHKIYILPEAQGKGIGKLLINEITKIARKKGNRQLSLNVNRNNPAVKVYERLGFQITDEEDIPIGNGFFMNDYVMEKSL